MHKTRMGDLLRHEVHTDHAVGILNGDEDQHLFMSTRPAVTEDEKFLHAFSRQVRVHTRIEYRYAIESEPRRGVLGGPFDSDVATTGDSSS